MTTETTPDAAWCHECIAIMTVRFNPVDDHPASDLGCPYIQPVDLMCEHNHIITTLFTDRRKT